jgi:formylglycine-generating enzyme required for sulfatase activity
MGSDKHYAEEAPEAPVHRVTVDGFWIDRTRVTNREFRKFVNATGHVTFAEIPPDPKDDPGALPHMVKAGSLVFTPPVGLAGLVDGLRPNEGVAVLLAALGRAMLPAGDVEPELD